MKALKAFLAPSPKAFLLKLSWCRWTKKVGCVGRVRQNFVAQLVQFLQCWLCDVRPSIVVEEKLAFFCWSMLAILLARFLVHLFDFLAVFLRCNSLVWVPETLMNLTSCRSLNSHDALLLVQFQLCWNPDVVQPLSWMSPVVIENPFPEKGRFRPHKRRVEATSKRRFFRFSSYGTSLSSF